MLHKGLTFRVMLALVLVLLLALPATVGAQDRPGEPKGGELSLQSVSVDDTPTPTQLAQLLVGTDVQLTNISFTGDSRGSGSFSGGTGIVGFESGVILGSGQVIDVVGPNSSDETTTDFELPGDSDLDALIPGYSTNDATVLEFDFECPEGTVGGDVISLYYVFTSEEYNEYVNSEFNDVFAFFLNGTNIALLPDNVTPVSINNVNNGYSEGGSLPGTNPSNPAYYINNDLNNGGGTIDSEADGLTVVLGAQANINPGVPNHMKLAIADAGDHVLDSWVFLEEGSFVCAPLNQPPVADPNGPYLGAAGSPIAFDGTGSSDPDDDPLTYAWDFGDSNNDTTATPSHTYTAAGIYNVCLTVNDGFVDSEEVCTIAVVYDPGAGFVTGGGWIDSPPGAYYPMDLPLFDGSYYELGFADPPVTWDQAEALASAMDIEACESAHLATVTSEAEQAVISGLMEPTTANGWLGGFQAQEPPFDQDIEAEDWQWITGEPFYDYENWADGEPNDTPYGTYIPGYEQHLETYQGSGLWNDAPGYEPKYHYVIEYEDCYLPTGKATFGFVSKYKKGANTPTGNTEFQFHAAGLNFHSSSYDWLVVTGSNYAKFKGSGTINGEGTYKFMLWAGDGDPDTFRIKIWEEDDAANETVIYDNGFNQPIEAGNIVIHTKK